MKLNRFSALAVTLIAAVSLGAKPTNKPNVVIIYGDDVGYMDVGANGTTEIPTPNIDSLAGAGLNFTDGHSSASTCTPSRFSMLTGIHAFRHGVSIAPPNKPLLIPTDVMTLPKLFQNAGYQTGIVGKWHLGLGEKDVGPQWNNELKPGPMELGFEYSFILPTTGDRVPCVYVDGHHVIDLDPNDPIYVGNTLSDVQKAGSTQYPDAKEDNTELFYSSIVNGIGRIGYMSGGKSALWDDYTMADVFADKAKSFISNTKDEPFFLFFSAHDIHIPNTPNERFQGATKLGDRGDAMVQFDWTVGVILDELEKHGLTENTIVIFTSDNGPTHHDDSYPATKMVDLYSPESGDGHDASGPWRGGKYEIYEGATRVPLIVQWPARVKPGTSDAMVSQIDFIGSFAQLLNVELTPNDAPDSRDTLDAFLGEDSKGLSFMIEESRTTALRVGDWKFIPGLDAKRASGFSPLEDTLYDLSNDIGEQNNVIEQYPERAEEMATQLKKIRQAKGIRVLK